MESHIPSCTGALGDSFHRDVSKTVLRWDTAFKLFFFQSLVRDRLYCARVGSNDHLSAQFTLHRVGTTIAKCMAPLLPHLAAEFFQHQPACPEKLVLRDILDFKEEDDVQFHPQLDLTMDKVLQLKSELAAAAGPSCDLFKEGALLELSPATKALLALWQEGETSFDSQLCEVFGVSMVRIREADQDRITPIKSEGLFCDRCRKMNRSRAEKHCSRCTAALESMNL
ncbi:hypothetical protein Y032_0053g2436 [Ancylostoma ceylanicum]|uniref:Methionyl/Valyl/Leucyl/Isoleucyl-tRNA synthetase anticodon-binding domain-containing protein n=1 Tax=Ancylostoma ceylanicum TaxID=53326 RepID=A0A016U6T4_9BILA|nr:hypothetical protein Y032_0053g2436 [Ancylostoma ceylanicum]